MKELLQGMAECAKTNLQNCGRLTPCFMFFKEELMLGLPRPMIPFPDCDSHDFKTRNLIAAGIFAKKLGADLVVYVSDAAFKTIDHPENYSETESPLLYPKTMRTECIIVTGIALPSGRNDTVMIPYKGGDGEPIEFLPNAIPEGVVYKTRFADLAVDGWNQADLIP